MPFSVPIPIWDVRLVVPLQDAFTGAVKDTVVEHLRGGEPFTEPPHGSSTPKHTRYISGPDEIEIPWPKPETMAFKAEAVDTLRIETDEVSFLPSIYNVPLPESAVSEIRSKDSRLRQVQSQEYIQKQMKVDAKRHWKRGGKMLSPRQEYWEQKARQKQAQGAPELTPETLKMIRDMQATSFGRKEEREDVA
jgi:large subunit ribosomal protein L24